MRWNERLALYLIGVGIALYTMHWPPDVRKRVVDRIAADIMAYLGPRTH